MGIEGWRRKAQDRDQWRRTAQEAKACVGLLRQVMMINIETTKFVILQYYPCSRHLVPLKSEHFAHHSARFSHLQPIYIPPFT
jgi:hypothetical protein